MPTATEKREFRRFTLVGFSATIIDYGILNVLTYFFGVPVVAANIASTLTSSLYSYILNRKVVFKSIAHGERKTLLLYVGSLAVSIFVIQSTIIGVLGHGVTASWFGALGFTGELRDFLAINAAKVIAGCGTLLWNFYTQRRLVFTSNSPKHN